MLESVTDFEDWRAKARSHLLRGSAPSDIVWTEGSDRQQFLFEPASSAAPVHGELSLPRSFVDAAKEAARHRAPSRHRSVGRASGGPLAGVAAG